MKPRLLDLFCGAGGAAVGYHRAGFEVVGVDIEPQPNYPFAFEQDDALMVLRTETDWANGFDAIHASPPCQAHVKGLAAVNASLGRALGHKDLIAATRALLIKTGPPYVIENVVGAPLLNPVQLCGSSFGLPIRRHRLFESNVPIMVPPCNHSWQYEAKYWTSHQPNREKRRSTVVQVYGQAADTHLWPAAMGIDWMTTAELREAIPPAYTEHVGCYVLTHLKAEVAA